MIGFKKWNKLINDQLSVTSIIVNLNIAMGFSYSMRDGAVS